MNVCMSVTVLFDIVSCVDVLTHTNKPDAS